MTRCPRCLRESAPGAACCGACGAPLLLADEGTPARLDLPLDLDRRAAVAALERRRGEPGEPLAAPPPARRAAPSAPAAGDDLPDADVDAVEVHLERGETWRRAGAWLVDAVPFAAAGVALGRTLLRAAGAAPAPPGGIVGILDLAARERVIVISLAAAVALALGVYATLAHALAGATLGKWLLRLRVVGPDGARPSPARSAARTALALVSAALLALGFLLALFTRSGRALHDLGARTWVVKAP